MYSLVDLSYIHDHDGPWKFWFVSHSYPNSQFLFRNSNSILFFDFDWCQFCFFLFNFRFLFFWCVLVFDCGIFVVVESTVSLCVCFVVFSIWFDRWFGAVGSNVCENWAWIERFLLVLGLNLLVELQGKVYFAVMQLRCWDLECLVCRSEDGKWVACMSVCGVWVWWIRWSWHVKSLDSSVKGVYARVNTGMGR